MFSLFWPWGQWLSDPYMIHWPRITCLIQADLPSAITEVSLRNDEPLLFMCWCWSTLGAGSGCSSGSMPSADCARQHTDSFLGVCVLGATSLPWVLTRMLEGLLDILQSLLNDYHLRRAFPGHLPKMLPSSFLVSCSTLLFFPHVLCPGFPFTVFWFLHWSYTTNFILFCLMATWEWLFNTCFILSLLLLLCVCVYVCELTCTSHGTLVEARGHPFGIRSPLLSLCSFQGLKSGGLGYTANDFTC